MASLNKVCVMGNLSRDVDLRSTPNGKSVAEISLAINHGYGDKADVCFVDVVVWGKIAENCKNNLCKGSCILVEGYLKMDSWEDKTTGKKRNKLRIVGETVQFISTPKGGNDKKGQVHEPETEDDKFAPPVKENSAPVSEDDIPF